MGVHRSELGEGRAARTPIYALPNVRKRFLPRFYTQTKCESIVYNAFSQSDLNHRSSWFPFGRRASQSGYSVL